MRFPQPRSLLGLLIVAGCAATPQPLQLPSLELSGNIVSWGKGTATLEAQPWPLEVVIASGEVNAEGYFRIALPGDLSASLLAEFADVVHPYHCTRLDVSPTSQKIAALYALTLADAEGALVVAASSEGFVRADYRVGDYGVMWFYTSAKVRIEATCTYQSGMFAYQLELAAGWNKVKVQVTDVGEDGVRFNFSVQDSINGTAWYRYKL